MIIKKVEANGTIILNILFHYKYRNRILAREREKLKNFVLLKGVEQMTIGLLGLTI